MLDFYAVLGLSRAANAEEIKAAYWTLAKQSHPDVNTGDGSEQRIKEINRAYETLGDPDARAAYDLEWQRRRISARRSFWSSAATGAATCMLTVGCFVLVTSRQHAAIHPSSSSEVASSAGSAGDKDLTAKPPADQAGVPPGALANARDSHPPNDEVVDAPSVPVNTARREHLAAGPPADHRAGVPPAEIASARGSRPLSDEVVDAPSEPVSTARNEDVAAKPPGHEDAGAPPAEIASATASHAAPGESVNPLPPEPIGETPSSANLKVASTELGDREAEAPGKRASIRDGSSDAELPNELSGTVQALEGQRVALAPVGITAGSTPEAGSKPAMPAAADAAALVPHEEPNTTAAGETCERTKRLFYKTASGRAMQGKSRASERGSRLVAKSAMALRFPSADEPYVNLGARDR